MSQLTALSAWSPAAVSASRPHDGVATRNTDNLTGHRDTIWQPCYSEGQGKMTTDTGPEILKIPIGITPRVPA